MKKIFILNKFVLLVILILFTGCTSDTKEIQNLNYATAIGVDYKDGNYYIYTQFVGLDSVAQHEGGTKPAQPIVSKTVGKTFIDGFFEVYQSAQQKIIWAHITSIILSDSALEAGIENIFDGLTRYYEFRLTPWVFATNEPIEQLLTTVGFFYQSPLETLLHNPENIYEQNSMVRPIRLHQLGREVFEPAKTTYIPTISINNSTWSNEKGTESKLELNGASFLQGKNYHGFYSLDELKGLRWITPETTRASILVPNEEDADFLLVFDRFDTEIKINNNDVIKYSLIFNGEGTIGNLLVGGDKLKHMEKMASEAVKKEIEDLIMLSIKDNTDFFNIDHLLFRKKNNEWKKIGRSLYMNEVVLEDVTVNVKIRHSGGYKNNIINMKD